MDVDLLVAGFRAMTFLVAVFAALVATQLYNLIRAGEIAQSWRSFIVGALVFAVWALAAFANTFFSSLFEGSQSLPVAMDGLQLLFILLFASGLWTQRQLFYRPDRYRPAGVGEDEDDLDAQGTDPDEEAA